MISKNALIVVLASSTVMQTTNAFGVRSAPSIRHRPVRQALYESSSLATDSETEQTAVADLSSFAGKADMGDLPVSNIVKDIPPSPGTVKPKPDAGKKVVAKKKGSSPWPKPDIGKKVVAKKKGTSHKEGVFSPIVVAAGSILGRDELSKIRAKVVAAHSDIIKSFVDTSDSTFGKAVLKELFTLVDTDNSGCLDKEELSVALGLLGFKWLDEKQVNKIFNKADVNGDQVISLEEFMNEAPKILKVNLIKLAKTNGGDMGLMV